MTKGKKKNEPMSLGEVTAGHFKDSVAGMVRLASPHPSVRFVLDVLERLRERPYITSAVISGEQGTGKEGLAHTLHELMHPEGGPLVSVSTYGRDEATLSRELFGSAPQSKGDRPSQGACGAADGGTLILDEVIGLPPTIQRRLLEVVKKGRYEREGDGRTLHTQLSIVAITDGNLPAEVAAGRFRHDLFHKLARLDLVLPPLRERPEDVPAAALWMAKRLLSDRGLSAEVMMEESDANPADGARVLSREAIDLLRAQKWPGNFRELEMVIERSLLLYSDGRRVTADDVSRALAAPRI
jgi:DNA-binding NtrC family response regulator